MDEELANFEAMLEKSREESDKVAQLMRNVSKDQAVFKSILGCINSLIEDGPNTSSKSYNFLFSCPSFVQTVKDHALKGEENLNIYVILSIAIGEFLLTRLINETREDIRTALKNMKEKFSTEHHV